ncbi:MAG: asparagine synthase (glutamine-hydrolyzing) [Clostridia bacterium]|nr:asparagine synthase (glutamine-hydrolyzing) [Clostridia bacterium]
MCGINGFINFVPGSKEQNANLISRMNSLITYRGPDDEGVFISESAALGMRRLAIIDLCTGNQPIFNEDGTKVIVFNGEVYNFKDLRNELLDKGHRFKTNGDTETILHAYEEYGVKCLDKLNGMFAFAIYDIKENELFIARDRAGEKPLYYYKDDERLIFASELKSIIKVFNIKKEINQKALNQYFSFTYIPAPLTIFKGIYKLEAAAYILLKNGEFHKANYWDIVPQENGFIQDYETCKRKLRESLFWSVEEKMISDVPLGAFLSGGIDSSIIVGVMSKLSSKPVETFNIGFKIKDFDESGKAKVVAERNKTNHHIHYLDYDDTMDALETILGTFDEPFADSSSIPTYFVSKFAREHVTVVLTGDAGDELFGGYSKYLINYYSDIYNKIPGVIRKSILEKLVYKLPDKNSFTRKVRKVIENSSQETFSKRLALMQLGFKEGARADLLKQGLIDSSSNDFVREVYDKYETFDELTKTLYTDFRIVLEGDMLVKVDRMSMLNSLETRVPLLDKNILELAFKIPPEFKIRGKEQKYILKDTFSDIIPKEVLKKGKQGFAVPIGEWFKGPLKESLLRVLSKEFIDQQGIFNYGFIKRLIEDHLNEKVNYAYPLWALYVFQNWYKKYFL